MGYFSNNKYLTSWLKKIMAKYLSIPNQMHTFTK